MTAEGPKDDYALGFQAAYQHHQAGRLVEAKAAYEALLPINPHDFNVLHLLGLVCFQSGDLAAAASLIARAVEVDAANAAAFANLSVVLEKLDRLDAALACCDRAIALRPDYPEAYFNRGWTRQRLGRLDAALADYDEAIRQRPDYSEAFLNRGAAHQALGRFEAALADFERAAGLNPTSVEALVNWAAALEKLGRFDTAIAACDMAIRLNPAYGEAYLNRGVALQGLERYGEALESYDLALSANPASARAHSNRAVALHALGRFNEMLASCDEAIRRDPGLAEAHANRGLALRAMDRFEEAAAAFDLVLRMRGEDAEAYAQRGTAYQGLGEIERALSDYDRAIALRPDYALAHCHRGVALYAMKRFDEALACHDTAIRLNPDYADAYTHRGAVLEILNQPEAALASYDRAVELNPDYARAYLNRSLLRLSMGRYEEGWRDFEWRKKTDRAVGDRRFDKPLWLGQEPPSGRTILVHWEQGFGDTLQFCRFLNPLRRRGARVLFSAQPPLASLLKTLAPPVELADPEAAETVYDYHCPLMSLPLALGLGGDDLGVEGPYLSADPKRVAAFAPAPKVKGLRVGLAWSGSIRHAHDAERSLPLSALAPILALKADFVSLQREYRPGEGGPLLSTLGVADVSTSLRDFSDTAALIAGCDLVISVDTAVAHLAGALGKPVWLMIHTPGDWRWLRNRSDSPWYPSVRLFRQPTPGDWGGVIAEVQNALAARLETASRALDMQRPAGETGAGRTQDP